MISDALLDAVSDTLRILPFLFAAFLALEAIEHYSGQFSNRLLAGVGKAGPFAGALLGCVPQCGFSAAAANLYSGGLISLGTLLAVFLSTSDEAVFILLAHPGNGKTVAILLLLKAGIGMTAGFLIDFLFRKQKKEKQIGEMCKTCGCGEGSGIFRPALVHTARLAAYLLAFTFCLNLALSFAGVERLARILGKDTPFQPFLAALLGMLPNCAASVLITELYLSGSLNFGAAIAGLCAGAGIGPAVLFRSNRSPRENAGILLLLYACAVLAGVIFGGISIVNIPA